MKNVFGNFMKLPHSLSYMYPDERTDTHTLLDNISDTRNKEHTTNFSFAAFIIDSPLTLYVEIENINLNIFPITLSLLARLFIY